MFENADRLLVDLHVLVPLAVAAPEAVAPDFGAVLRLNPRNANFPLRSYFGVVSKWLDQF